MFNRFLIHLESMSQIKNLYKPCFILYNANNINESNIAFLTEKYLHDNEKIIIERRKKIVAKKEYIASRFLIKTYIAQRLNISYQALQLTFDEKASKLKAIYKNKSLALNVSLAHSKGLIFFGITEGETELGVDIEYHNPVRNTQALINAYFHPEEIELLHKGHSTSFYSLWTLKEALAKLTTKTVLEVLGENTMQSLAHYHYTTAQYDQFNLAIVQTSPIAENFYCVIDHEKTLQLSHE